MYAPIFLYLFVLTRDWNHWVRFILHKQLSHNHLETLLIHIEILFFVNSVTFWWRNNSCIASKKTWVLPILETLCLVVPGATNLSKSIWEIAIQIKSCQSYLYSYRPYYCNSSPRWFLTLAEVSSSALTSVSLQHSQLEYRHWKHFLSKGETTIIFLFRLCTSHTPEVWFFLCCQSSWISVPTLCMLPFALSLSAL